MKQIVLSSISICLLVSSLSFTALADSNEPTTENIKKTEQSLFLLDQAKAAGIVSASEAGIASPTTVFVPGRYTQSKLGALYIKGGKVSIPNIRTDIIGFIPTKGGYVVANYNPQGNAAQISGQTASPSLAGMLSPDELSKLTVEQKLRYLEAQAKLASASASSAPTVVKSVTGEQVQFYLLDTSGKVKSLISAVNTDSNVVAVTPHAIYASQPVSKWNDVVPLRSYSGVNDSLQTVTGPQDVMFGTPAENGTDWYVTKPVSGDNPRTVFSYYNFGMYLAVNGGELKLLRKGSVQYTTVYDFSNTTGIFVDSPNISDSARTGYMMLTYGETRSATTSDFFNFAITPYSFAVKLPTRTQIDCFGLCNHEISVAGHHVVRVSSKVGSNHSMSAAIGYAKEAASRAGLFNFNGAVTFASQENIKNSLNYDLVDITTNKSTDVYSVMGTGANIFRSMIGQNTNDISFSARNDVFLVYTPKGTILIKAGTSNQPTSQSVYLESGKALSADDVSHIVNQRPIFSTNSVQFLPGNLA